MHQAASSVGAAEGCPATCSPVCHPWHTPSLLSCPWPRREEQSLPLTRLLALLWLCQVFPQGVGGRLEASTPLSQGGRGAGGPPSVASTDGRFSSKLRDGEHCLACGWPEQPHVAPEGQGRLPALTPLWPSGAPVSSFSPSSLGNCRAQPE